MHIKPQTDLKQQRQIVTSFKSYQKFLSVILSYNGRTNLVCSSLPAIFWTGCGFNIMFVIYVGCADDRKRIKGAKDALPIVSTSYTFS